LRRPPYPAAILIESLRETIKPSRPEGAIDVDHGYAPAPSDRLRSARSPHEQVDKAIWPSLSLNLMVKYQDRAREPILDRTFAALADPTRRALIARLGERESLSVSELARPFPVSLPAIMKHLDVLSDAGLVTRTKTGRTVACQLSAAPMEDAMIWLSRYQRFWSEQLDRLAAFVEEDSCSPTPTSPPSPASPSSGGSTPRPRKSTPRGRSPRS
jgi:DNA-binding transcriptional ArsR family regulator